MEELITIEEQLAKVEEKLNSIKEKLKSIESNINYIYLVNEELKDLKKHINNNQILLFE